MTTSSTTNETLSAEVAPGTTPGELRVTPSRRTDRDEIARTLRRVGLRRIRVMGSTIIIDAKSARALLTSPPTDLDLEWDDRARRIVENRVNAEGLWPHAHEVVSSLRSAGPTHALVYALRQEERLGDLDDHQLVNVAAMTDDNVFGLCLFDEQGAGKTVSVLYAFDHLVATNRADVLVVVSPKSMLPEWEKETRRFMGDLYRVAVVSGHRRERHHAIHSGADILVLNFEGVSTHEADIASLAERCRGRAVLVIDESYHIKNPDAQRTTAVGRIREMFGRAWILCGTPAPNSPRDLVSQFDLVDYGITFDGVDVPDDRVVALDIVRDVIELRGLYLRHLKEHVLPDLPAKSFTRLRTELQPMQTRAYEAAANSLIADLREMSDEAYARHLPTVLARRMALLQICSNPTLIVPGYDEVPSKLLALDTLLDEAVANRGQKVVVWSSFTHSLEAILERFRRFNPVRYDGKVTSVEERGNAVRAFQEDDSTMLFVANPAAGGAGLTLHRAHLAVYESLSNQAAHFMQSVDRLHRRGQTRDVEYVVLITSETIEEAEFQRLADKETASHDLFGDIWTRPPSREALLDELLTSHPQR